MILNSSGTIGGLPRRHFINNLRHGNAFQCSSDAVRWNSPNGDTKKVPHDRFPDADKFTFLILQQKHTASMWLQDAMRQRHILQAVLHI